MHDIISLNRKWAFRKNVTEIPDTFRTDWDIVNLPHTWNGIDGQDGGADYWRGTACYAHTFTKSELPEADCYVLDIPAANASADVYVNGIHMGHHDGGYSAFRFDITSALAEENLLCILVDNSANDHVYPQSADFTFYGGLYRGVKLIALSASHFDILTNGSPGLHVRSTFEGDDALVTVKTSVLNRKDGQQIRFEIRDEDAEIVAEATGSVEETVLRIPHVHRWHGKKDPYLYVAEVDLLQDETVLDEVYTIFGCREFRIDPEKGFILNGEPYPLRGVCRHQDRPDIGNTLSWKHHDEDVDIICEMGANTIRLAHYQQAQEMYDRCDDRGLIVWAEIPYISAHMPGGRENTITQMRELIEQNDNHPSIVVWGLSNEITMLTQTNEDMLENHRILNDMVHEMDDTRLTTMAVVSMCSIDDPIVHISDVVSYNLYFGWYSGKPEMTGPWLDRFHEKYPETPIGISEYGAEALDWHSGRPHQGDYTEEYQALYHEKLIEQLYSRPYIWAAHVWNMFDFAADARDEGGEAGLNHKGLVTFDRKYKKDAFYAYKAWLSDEPFVHISGKRYFYRSENPTLVTVYSNQPEVELFANGKSLGKQRADNHFFHFEVPNEDETVLVAMAGNRRDMTVVSRVSEPYSDYILQEKGAVLNWTDITEPEGFYSLSDTIGDIRKSPEGDAYLMANVMGRIPPRPGQTEGKNQEKQMEMAGGFTLLRLIRLSRAPFTREELLEVNRVLNSIPKVV